MYMKCVSDNEEFNVMSVSVILKNVSLRQELSALKYP
jgi:hypothetical protein